MGAGDSRHRGVAWSRLGVKLAGTKGSVIGWMFSGELQRLVGGNNRLCDS